MPVKRALGCSFPIRYFGFIAFSFLIIESHFSFSQNFRSVIQRGHGQVVKSSILSPDNKLVFTASRDKTIKIWDLEKGHEIRSLFGHESTVNHLELNTDGSLLASTSSDNTTRVWDVKKGEEIFKVVGDNYMTDAVFSPNGKYLACGGYDWHISIWDLQDRKKIKSIKVGPEKGIGYGIDLEFSPDGKYLAIGEDNQKIRLLSTENWEIVQEFPIEKGFCGGCIAFVKFGQDGSIIKVAQKGLVELFKLSPESGVWNAKSFGKNGSEVSSIDISKYGNLLVAGEKLITVLQIESGDTLLVFEPMVKEINEARFDPSGEKIIVSGNDNKASLFSSEDGTLITEFSGILNLKDLGGLNFDPDNYWQHQIANNVRLKNLTQLSPDGKNLIRGKFGNKLKMWELYSGKNIREYSIHEKAVLAFDISKDGKQLISGGGEGRVILWDMESGDTLKVLGKHSELVFDTRFSNNGKMALSSSWSSYCTIWDLETGTKKNDLRLENTAAYTATFTPNDLYLVLGNLNKSLEMWEPDSKTLVRKFIGHTDIVSQINFNSNGNLMLSSSRDGSSRIWNIGTGLQENKFITQGQLYTAVFSPDEKYVVTGGEDLLLKFWNISNSSLEFSLSGHQSPITNIIFTKDKKKLISVDMDGVTKIWDLGTKKLLFEQIHIGKNDWMVRTTEGYFSATDGARKYIHFSKGYKTYELDQFFHEFYRPDLIKDLLKGDSKRNIPGLGQKVNSNPPPEVKIAAISKDNGKKALLMIRVIDNGAGFKGLKLFQNGKRIANGDERVSKPTSKKGDTSYFKVETSLVHGKNFFEASASNKAKLESSMAKTMLQSQTGELDSRCFIFTIGINEYKNPKLNLNYAKADAKAFSSLFAENAKGIYKEVKILSLFDDSASRELVLKTLDYLSEEITLNDVFVFYYAGHGTMVENNFYFVPHESTRLFDQKSLEESALPASILQEKFQQIKALKQIIIMDACQSGGSVELLAQRGAPEEKAMAQLSRSVGIHVMASAGSDQYATEFESLGHGLFTYILLEALSGKADGAPADDKVTIYELKSYLDDQVPSWSQEKKGTPQYPFTFSRGNDFPLVIQKE